MRVNIVIPQENSYAPLGGFNEVTQSELAAIFTARHWEVMETEGLSADNCDFTILVCQYNSEVFETVSSYRKKDQTLTCMVGKAVTAARFYILSHNHEIEFVIRGEVELTLIEIAEQLEKERLELSEVRGITLRNNAVITDNLPRNSAENYNDFPLPSFSYLGQGKKKYPICVLSSSKGCHGECYFCEGFISRQHTQGPIYRAKSAERVVDEIMKVYRDFKYRIFTFSDDNFFVDGEMGLERAIRIVELIKRNKINIRFTIECRADDINENIVNKLKSAGLYKIYIGVESGSDHVLERYNKGVTVEQNVKAIETLFQSGILCEPGYILFDPQTSRQELLDTVDFFGRYADKLYVPIDRDDRFALSVIGEGPLINKWYHNMDDATKFNIISGDKNGYFVTEEAMILYNNFIDAMKNNARHPKEKILQYRLKCIEKSFE